MSDSPLLINRPCIYERQLPGDAYITVHVQRLQHGYYFSPGLPELDAEHVDFLGISFVFHSTNTLSHRFKSATIRVRIDGGTSSAPKFNESALASPRFLMHAPHLIYGTVSPETMDWTFSLAGSLGISQTPVSANFIPSGSVNGRYQRYEMMRIQGSVRTLRSPRGSEFDAQNAEILWSLEENNLQRSGLPREFTFAMLVQKPSANSNMELSLSIDPVIANWSGSYPSWWLKFPQYEPVLRQVDFSRQVGQPFEPAYDDRGFNFATLVTSFDDYVAMPGRKVSRSIQYPPASQLPQAGNSHQGNPGQYGSLNAMPQLYGNRLATALLDSQLRRIRTQGQGVVHTAPPAPATTGMAGTMAGSTTNVKRHNNAINIRRGVGSAMVSQKPKCAVRSAFSLARSRELRESRRNDTDVVGYGSGSGLGYSIGNSQIAAANSSENNWLVGGTCASLDGRPIPNLGSGDQSYESIRTRMLHTVRPRNRESFWSPAHRVMALENRPLTPELLAGLSAESSDAERGQRKSNLGI